MLELPQEGEFPVPTTKQPLALIKSSWILSAELLSPSLIAREMCLSHFLED